MTLLLLSAHFERLSGFKHSELIYLSFICTVNNFEKESALLFVLVKHQKGTEWVETSLIVLGKTNDPHQTNWVPGLSASQVSTCQKNSKLKLGFSENQTFGCLFILGRKIRNPLK